MHRTIRRRAFLKRVAIGGMAGAAGPMVCSALANRDSIPANDKITIGCIGVGGMGTYNMKNFLGLPECRIVAVCDAYADRRQRAKDLVDAQYGDAGCKTYADFRDLIARKDGTNGAQAVLAYLGQLPPLAGGDLDGLRQKLRQLPKPVVNKEDWARLERVEQAEAAQRGLPEFKFSTNDEMLAAMGLVAADGGAVRVFGRDPRQAEPAVRARIGFVHDTPAFYDYLSVERVAAIVAAFYAAWDASLFHHLLAEFGVPRRARVWSLSHGTRMKFALALALSHHAELLLLDEPTTGLDLANQHLVLELIDFNWLPRSLNVAPHPGMPLLCTSIRPWCWAMISWATRANMGR